nr:protein FAM216A [Misgurnus anguillicaudatus]
MKKHVKCLENRDKSDPYHKTSFLRLNNGETDKTTPIFGHKMQRPAKVVEQNREKKTICIPKTMTDAPFLQHPGLTPGQKRFLYSIAEAYSKDHMRRLICQHYINVIHRCIRTDLNPRVKPRVTTIYSPELEHITESQTTKFFGTKEHEDFRLQRRPRKQPSPKSLKTNTAEEMSLNQTQILSNMRVMVRRFNCFLIFN